MLNYYTDCLATVPEITLQMNCDTILAINLRMFDLGDNDEFIFAIKNYNYIDSPYVFLFRARKADMDDNGEVVFKVPLEASKELKHGAFYNFAVLVNAFDTRAETLYKKLTEDGAIRLEYGAQDILIKPEVEIDPNIFYYEICDMQLELLDDTTSNIPDTDSEVVSVSLERIDDITNDTSATNGLVNYIIARKLEVHND